MSYLHTIIASVLAGVIACIWLGVSFTKRVRLVKTPGTRLYLSMTWLFAAPLCLYLIAAGAMSAAWIDGQWTWLGETMQVPPAQEFFNNLFMIWLITFPFPFIYVIAGAVIFIVSLIKIRKKSVKPE